MQTKMIEIRDSNWDNIDSGQVVDVEFISGITHAPKTAEIGAHA